MRRANLVISDLVKSIPLSPTPTVDRPPPHTHKLVIDKSNSYEVYAACKRLISYGTCR